MSIDVMTWVFRNSETTGNDRLVLLTIADEADDDGTNAYPSIDRISRKARLPKRTTMRCLQRLEEQGALIVHRPEQRGRGHFNTYVVVLDASEKGDTLTPEAERERARKGAQRRAPVRDLSQTHRPTDFDSESIETQTDVVARSASSQNDDAAPEIALLCDQLADAIERHRDGSDRPKITKRWHDDMRKLVERGPLHVENPQPLTVEHVSAGIRVLFSDLAERGKDGFCWADQIRSPHALRDHWHQLRDALRRQRQGRKSRGAQAIDRVAKRMAAQSDERPPLGLLRGGGT